MKKPLLNSKVLATVFFLMALFFANESFAQVTTVQDWSNLYNNTSTSSQSVSYTVPAGSNSSRVLAVAIASSQTSTGARTVTITYGGQTMTLAAGNMGTTNTRQHTAIYYLNEAGLDAATNSNLVFTVSGGTTRVTTVSAAVFDYVDQATPTTNTQNYNNIATATDPFVFGTALTINSGDQAVLVISSVRAGNNTPRSLTMPTNFTSSDEVTWTTTDGVRNAVANRSVPGTNTSSTCSTAISGNGGTLGSMTGVSFKGCSPATANAGSALAAICQGGVSAALGGSIGGSATGGTWSDDGVGGTFTPNATTLNATWTPPVAYSGTATLTLTTTGGSCGAATASKTQLVNPGPTSVTANTSISAICTGGSVDLTSGASSNSSTAAILLNENFNGAGAPTGWVANNASTNATPANAAWTLRPNNYNSGSSYGITIRSNDSSQFYLSDSDMQGNGGTTNTSLQTPSFSTVGLNAATLTFYHYYRDNGSDYADVQISTNGTSWTTLAPNPTNTFPGSRGNATGFQQEAYDLSSYLNQPTVYILFKYSSSWGYYWAIDNVVVSGTYSTPPPATFAWTSTPAGYTSSAQNPTGVSPTVNTSYTVTATNSYGCTATATTSTVNVSAVPASGTLSPTPAAGFVCPGTSVSATATAGSGGVGTIVDQLEYSLNGGAYIAYTSGTSINTTGQTSVSIRTRRTATGSGCTSSGYNTVTWTMNTLSATPSAITGTSTICNGGNTTLTVSGGTAGTGAVAQWFAGSCGGTSAGTGNSISVSPTSTTTYYVRYSGTCNTTGCASQVVTVNSLSTAPTSISGTTAICNGSGTTLTLVGGSAGTGATAQWFTGSCGGTSAGTGNSISPSPSIATTYYVRYSGTCNTTACASQSITVNPRPTASVLSGGTTICSGSSANLQVAITGGTSPFTVVHSGGTVNSYTSGSNIPVTPSGTTNYSLTSVTDANGCVGIGNIGSANVVIDVTTSTNGGVSWSNGTPSGTKSVIFDGSSATLATDFTACSLRLTNSAVVNVSTGVDVTLNGKLTVDSGSTFTLNNNANLLQNTTLANTGNIVVKRNSSALKRLDYTLWSSPVTGQGVYAFSPSTFGNRFYVYRTNTNVFNNADLGFNITSLDQNGVNGTDSNNVQFAKAKGYLIRMPWDHPTAATVWNSTFNGVPNNGDITFTMTNGGAGQRFNLVGNPYPSPISISQFVSDNSAKITGSLYFWRETNNNTSNNAYCSWAGGTFTTNSEAQVFNPNGIIRTGQGFFVEASGAATTVDFKNGQRSSDNANQFFRNANVTNDVDETNRFWLNLTNASGAFSQMAAGYMSNATNGVDLYDGKNINTGNVLLNSILDNTDYTIQGKALPFNASDVIPLSCKITTAGSYTIAIDHVDGLFTDGTQAIYLKDNLTATEHNLQTGSYTFASDAGTFNDRFEITYQAQLSVPVFTPNSVVIYSQNNNFVVNSGNVIMASIKVFDIRGRLLQEKAAINANQATINGGSANQVLLVQITSEDGAVITKKVIR